MKKYAVLISGGIESCVLLAEFAKKNIVYPIHINKGFIWEKYELQQSKRFIKALHNKNIKKIIILDLNLKPIYKDTWLVLGKKIPRLDGNAKHLNIIGRNILLLSIAVTWCALHQVNYLIHGHTAPSDLTKDFYHQFHDVSKTFFNRYMNVLNTGLGTHIHFIQPFRKLKKKTVVKKFAHYPLHLSFSCINPKKSKHCGSCIKCIQRQQAFEKAGIQDNTVYA